MGWVVAAAMTGATSPAPAATILFVGNSFTFGANSPVMRYRPDLVRDLNREGIGGVPALFKTFAEETGQDWTVSLETAGGRDLAYHYEQKRREIDGRWDVVILQGYSTLDPQRPGDPVRHAEAAGALAAMFRQANPRVRVELVSTWSRADLTYRTASPGGASRSRRWRTMWRRAMPMHCGDIPRSRGRSRSAARGTAPGPSGSPIPTPMTASLSVRSICGPGINITPARRAIIWKRW